MVSDNVGFFLGGGPLSLLFLRCPFVFDLSSCSVLLSELAALREVTGRCRCSGLVKEIVEHMCVCVCACLSVWGVCLCAFSL